MSEAEGKQAVDEVNEATAEEVLEGTVIEASEAVEASEVEASDAGVEASEVVEASDAEVEAQEAEAEVGAEVEAEEPEPEEESLEGRLERAEADAAEWKVRALRQAADLENARRRFTKEREDLRKFGTERLLKDMLPIIDNLERAVEHAENPDGPLAKGVQMVVKQFGSELAKYGAKAFDAKGEVFDPQKHEAMTEMETAEVPPGHVFQVFQRGWTLHDRLVRPAMVIVAKAPAPTDDDDATDAGDE